MAKKSKKPSSVKKPAKKNAEPKAAAHKKQAKSKPTKGVAATKKPVQKEQMKKEVPLKKTVKTETKAKPVIQTKPETRNAMPGTEGKKRLIISYEKLPPGVLDVIRTKYPYGYNHDLKEVKGIDNKKFYVLPIELPDVIYLVKVDLKKPIKIDDAEDEEDMFTPAEEFAAGEDNFPTEEIEPIEGEGEPEPEEEGGGKKKNRNRDDEDDD